MVFNFRYFCERVFSARLRNANQNMKKRNILIIILSIIILSVVILSLSAVLSEKNKLPETEQKQAQLPAETDIFKTTQEDVKSVSAANNQFALELYSALKEGENIFFSPYSIFTALAMAYEGADTETAQEIQSVFHFPKDDNGRRQAFAAIHKQLNENKAGCEIKTANSLWVQNDYPFLKSYLDIIKKYYAGEAANVDFKRKTEEARKKINDWTKEKTNGKIEDLFPKGSLNQITRLVLANAVYFKGMWLNQFDEKETMEEDFWVNSDRTVKVPMMKRVGKNAKFNYTEVDGIQILEMPYESEKLSMFVFLPEKNNLEGLESSFNPQKLSQWKSELRKRSVDVYIPKFTFDGKFNLNQILKELGMPLAFSFDANFSKMDGTQDLFIQKVIHSAFINVNEEGAEAAAATGVSVGIKFAPAPQPVFRADHPFIFLIQEKETDNILFIGRVVNPVIQ